MKTILLLIALVVLLTSCYDSRLTDPIEMSANLKIKVYVNNNIPAINAKIIIYKINIGIIINDSTDTNGELNVKLLEGGYYVTTSINEGLVLYTTEDNFEILGGIDLVREYRPFDNIGNINILIYNYYNRPISDINVALLAKYYDYNIHYSFNEYYSKMFMVGKTDANGQIIFTKVPSNYYFSTLIFRNDSLYVYNGNGVNVQENSDDYFFIEHFNY